MKNNALEMFMQSIEMKIEESRTVSDTLDKLNRLIKIYSESKKVMSKITKSLNSIQSGCVYSESKLNLLKDNVCELYKKLESFENERDLIKKSLPLNAKYYNSMGSYFEVNKSLEAIEKGHVASAKFFIKKFKYELENEEVYKEEEEENK